MLVYIGNNSLVPTALFTFSCLIVFVVVWMVGVTGLVNDCVKTVFLVGYVFDGPQRTIGVVHAVRSLHHVTVSVFVRGLVVAGVRVLHAVFVRVFWMSLRGIQHAQCTNCTHTHTR
jgi:hypothetical protein